MATLVLLPLPRSPLLLLLLLPPLLLRLLMG